MIYKLTVGGSSTGYSSTLVAIGPDPKTGALTPTFAPNWARGLTRQHSQALRSAARHLAHSIDMGELLCEVPTILDGATACGDVLPVRWVANA